MEIFRQTPYWIHIQLQDHVMQTCQELTEIGPVPTTYCPVLSNVCLLPAWRLINYLVSHLNRCHFHSIKWNHFTVGILGDTEIVGCVSVPMIAKPDTLNRCLNCENNVIYDILIDIAKACRQIQLVCEDVTHDVRVRLCKDFRSSHIWK